jgi:hypothetical protein
MPAASVLLAGSRSQKTGGCRGAPPQKRATPERPQSCAQVGQFISLELVKVVGEGLHLALPALIAQHIAELRAELKDLARRQVHAGS